MIIRMTAAALTMLVGISAAQSQGPYAHEQAARSCIQKRLTELLAEKKANIAADTVLSTCTGELRAELKVKGKTYCEAVGYIAWLVADENSKRSGVSGQPYKPDKSFLQHCSKSETWEKHP